MIVTKKGENGIETMMSRPDKTRITVNGEIDASKTILREGTVIMAERTTRENGVTRKTAGETMEGGEDTVTQPLRQTVGQTSIRNGLPIPEETHDGQS